MPISFVACFFGMNFFEPVAHMTRWTDQPAFVVMFLITILLPTGILHVAAPPQLGLGLRKKTLDTERMFVLYY